MATLKDICNVISEKFPPKIAEEWDNPGIQIGREKAEIHRVLVALELTKDIIKEAITGNFQLILTHHPFIFRPIKSICDATPDGEMLLELAENHIALLAAHTNLDAAPQSIGEKLADDLHLENREIFLPYEAPILQDSEKCPEYGFGVCGSLPESMTLETFILHLKKIWGIPAIRAAGDPMKSIRNIAILNGSGSRYLTKCRKADAYITGDCGHHDFDLAGRLGIALIDAGHYDTEKFIPEILANSLRNSVFGNQLDIVIAKSLSNPMRIY